MCIFLDNLSMYKMLHTQKKSPVTTFPHQSHLRNEHHGWHGTCKLQTTSFLPINHRKERATFQFTHHNRHFHVILAPRLNWPINILNTPLSIVSIYLIRSDGNGNLAKPIAANTPVSSIVIIQVVTP